MLVTLEGQRVKLGFVVSWGKPVGELGQIHLHLKILQHVKIEAELPTHFDLFSPMTYWRTDTNAHLNKNIHSICHVSV